MKLARRGKNLRRPSHEKYRKLVIAARQALNRGVFDFDGKTGERRVEDLLQEALSRFPEGK